MKKFWIVYILVAIVGSIIVWYVSPLMRPVKDRFDKQKKVAVREGTESVLKSPKKLMGVEFKSDEGGGLILPSKSSDSVKKSDEGDVEDAPALLGIFRATPRNKVDPSWGVVRQKTNFYNSQGKRLGEIPGGIILKFIESRKSSKGTMVLCKFKYKGKVHGPYLVKRTEISLFSGSFMDLSENQRKKVEEYYRLKGLMEERGIEVMDQMAKKNPHYFRYKSAYDKYMDHIEAARELTAQRDRSSGLKRSRLDDQLRRMKNEEVKLNKDYNQIHNKYKAWKKDNAADLPDKNIDPKIREYRMEMKRISRLIPGLAY